MILKTYTTLNDGRACNPYYKILSLNGFILFRKGFTNKLFSFHKLGAIHILGFRWVVSITN